MKNIILFNIIIILFLLGNKSFSQPQNLETNGYFDFLFEFGNKDSSLTGGTFDQRHLNFLATYILDDHFRVSTEVDWEHGPMFSSGSGAGEIYLAKAFLEYKYTDALLVRLGKFLSPFGIYNELHDATPTFLSSNIPRSVYGSHKQSYGNPGRLYAKQSTGIQILGDIFVDNWGLKYQAYMNNGRGPEENELDNNSNKGFGARVVISPPIEELKIGASYYTDKNGNANNTLQSTLGFDFMLNISDARFEAEYIIPKLEKVDSSGKPNGNFRKLSGYYVMGAYTFFNLITPFARYEFFDPDTDLDNNSENIIVLGLNLAVTSSVFWKSEIDWYNYQNSSVKKYWLFVTSVAVAF